MAVEETEVEQGLTEETDRINQVKSMMSGGKIPPEEVNYGPAPENSPESCGGCMFYEMPGEDRSTCQQVAGEVQASGVCDIFEPAMDGQGQPGTAAEGMMNELPENSIHGL